MNTTTKPGVLAVMDRIVEVEATWGDHAIANAAREASATVKRLADALTVYVNSAPTDTLTQRAVRAEAIAALAEYRGGA